MSGRFGKGHHLHLIDGSAFIFRAYHALPPLTRKSDGLPIGAVSGFCNMLQRYIDGNNGSDAPTHVAVIFDKGSHTFRNEMYDQYKANREAMPEDLRPQIPLTRAATEAFNIACEEMEGFEADDIIATLAVQARAAGGRCTIISSDKDLMQLVGDGVEMLDAMKNKRIDRDGVLEKFGVYPDRVVDVQALAGDSVDNVPGAPGIGIKTAALLINEYGDLETLLERAGEIKQPKRRETLINHAEQIRLSKKLVQLDEQTPLDFTLDDLEVREPDPEKLLAFLAEMEFRTLTKRIAEALHVQPPEIDDTPASVPDAPEIEAVPFDTAGYEQVSDAEALQVWIDRIYERGYVAVDTETTGLDEMIAELVGISLCVDAGQACYIPLTHKAGASDDLFGSDDLAEGQMPLEEALRMLTPVLQDPSILKIGQNMKYDAKIFAQLGIEVAPIDDTMLLSYAQHAGLHGHGMDQLSERYLNHTPIPIKPLLGSGKSAITFDKVPVSDAVPYAAEDADITLRLHEAMWPRLVAETGLEEIFRNIEIPLVAVLSDMEQAGVAIDTGMLAVQSGELASRILEIEQEAHREAGQPFNLGSPKQIQEILFDKLQLPVLAKTPKGAPSTAESVLQELALDYPLPRLILEHRSLSKLKSTYTDKLPQQVNPSTGRVHTSYHQAVAATGRLSSSDPNLQNIPIRTEEGRRIRQAFVPEAGCRMVAADYSQIELRIMSHLSGDEALLNAFAEGKATVRTIDDLRVIADMSVIVAASLIAVAAVGLGWWAYRSRPDADFRPGQDGILALSSVVVGWAMVGWAQTLDSSTVTEAIGVNSLVVLGLGLVMTACLATVRAVERIDRKEPA